MRAHSISRGLFAAVAFVGLPAEGFAPRAAGCSTVRKSVALEVSARPQFFDAVFPRLPPTRVEDTEIRGVFSTIANHAVFNEGDARPVLLWDGTCGFCDAGVWAFIEMERDDAGDGRGSVRFATQESELGLELLALLGETPQSLNSVALLDARGRVYTHSAACLKLSRKLRAPLLQVGQVGALLPKSVRDYAYGWVADHRHQLLGDKDSCRIPTEEQLSRFITDL